MARILLSGDTVGGVWTFTLDLAEGLISRGYDVCLATFGRFGSAAQKAEAAAIPGLLWLDSDFKLEWMEDPWDDVERSGRWLMDIACQFKPDLVHLNTLCHCALDWHAPVVVTVHSCVQSWWEAVKREPLPAQWDRYCREVRRSLQCADVVTAPSLAMLASVRQNYAIPEGRVIANGRRVDLFHSGPKEPFILAAGRLWDEGKNVLALAEIAPELPWPVFLAGEPGSLSNCRILGHLSSADLASWYARAAIYCVPARYEPFGLSPLEAALSGCALVLGDIPSLREVWGDAAIFVPPDDATLLQAALKRLIENPADLKAMPARATARARGYTQSRMVSEYLDAYPARRLACAS